MPAIALPRSLDLTAARLAALSPPEPPIIAGDTWSKRFRVADPDDLAVDLTDALIALSVKVLATDTDPIYLLEVGAGITIDADQTDEDVEAGTGKGWFEVTQGPNEEEAILTAIGALASRQCVYDIRILFDDDEVHTYASGLIELKRPITLGGEFEPPAP